MAKDLEYSSPAIETIHPGSDSPEPKAPGTVLRHRDDPRAGQFSRSAGFSIEGHLPCPAIQPAERLQAPYPEQTTAVLENRSCVVHVQAVRIADPMLIYLERRRPRREAVHSGAVGSSQHVSLAVQQQPMNLVAAQAVGVGRIIPIPREPRAFAIQLQDAAGCC